MDSLVKVAELANPSAAQTFADFCRTRGKDVQVVAVQGNIVALFCHPDDQTMVLHELALFAADPFAQKYNAAAWQLGRPKVQPASTASWGEWLAQLRLRTGSCTLLLSALIVTVFIALQVWPEPVFEWLRMQDPQPLFSLRWWSPMLLHFSSAHLMFNLFAFLVYGGRLEQRLGSRWFLALVLAIGLLSNVAQWWVSGPYFGGLSGVVYGIFGFVWCYGLRNPQQDLKLSHVDLALAVGFMLLGFADLLWVNTANWAHLVGFMAGLVFAMIPRRQH